MNVAEPTLLVLAAGMGSRFGGLKQIEPIGPHGETLLDYSVFDAGRAGFGRVVFVIRREFEEVFRERAGRRVGGHMAVDYVHQELDRLPAGHAPPPGRVKPWGTGHAIWCARDFVHGPFVVINGDDFYGRDAFAQMAGFFSATVKDAAESGPARFAMAGYVLGETLSDFGAVSRGICELDASGRLRGIAEVTGIERDSAGGGRVSSPDGTVRTLAAETIVSMNFWGLTPAVFALVDEQFGEFLARRGRELKSEFYLPAVVEHAVQSGRATVNVLPSRDSWFGVTHRDDVPRVRDAIRRLIAAGNYPASL